eukprot:7383601-Prymnesium_polylepis.3
MLKESSSGLDGPAGHAALHAAFDEDVVESLRAFSHKAMALEPAFIALLRRTKREMKRLSNSMARLSDCSIRL